MATALFGQQILRTPPPPFQPANPPPALRLRCAPPMRPVEVMPWGQTIAYVADINGFLVALCTPVG